MYSRKLGNTEFEVLGHLKHKTLLLMKVIVLNQTNPVYLVAVASDGTTNGTGMSIYLSKNCKCIRRKVDSSYWTEVILLLFLSSS